MLCPDLPVVTERLLLRTLTRADVDAVHAYQSRADVCRYIPYAPRSRETVAERIDGPYARTVLDEPGQALLLGIEVRESGLVVGDVMLLWTSREHGCGEIGYVLHPDQAGHGYATEAAAALLHLGFDELGLHRIVARLDERNTASAGVVTRLGLRLEGRLVENEWFKGEWSTELDFAILASEWRAARRPT